MMWNFNSLFPRWAVMWGISIGIYALLKVVSWVATDRRGVNFRRQIAYLVAWPGMDGRAFLDSSRLAKPPTLRESGFAILKTFVGTGLIGIGLRVASHADSGNLIRIAGWIEMVGIILALHCGLFHCLSCWWRSEGIDAPPIMNSPLLSTSLAEFWGRRWNLAFRDPTHRFVFTPVANRRGSSFALGCGFLISGLIHELAITVPADSGYGGPTTYFLIQAIGLSFERSTMGRHIGLARGIRGRCFCLLMVTLPLGLLFPDEFVRRIIVPFFRDASHFICCSGSI